LDRITISKTLPGYTLAAVIRLLANIAAISIGFGLFAWLGIALARDEGRIAAVWFPNAMLIVVLLRTKSFPPHLFLPFTVAANIVANLAWGDTLLIAAGLSLSNAIEILIVLSALRHAGCAPPDFCNNRHTFTFALIAIAASAISGLAALAILQPEGSAAMLDLWWHWARADALGLALLVPALTLLANGWDDRHKLTRDRIAEALAIIAFGTAVSCYTFYQTSFPFLFLDAPLVLLYAIRLGPLGNAIAIINLAIVASIFTILGRGPINLMTGDLSDKLMVLQVFLASSFAIGLPIASLLRQREQAVAARAEFLAQMSHELRTPMNAMLGFTELLDQSDLTTRQREYLGFIGDSGQTMLQLLNNVLDLSQVESGQIELESEPFDLREVIAGSVGLFGPRANFKGVSLSAQIDPAVPHIVFGDSLRLRQILLNLLGNAVKFTQSGEIRVDVSNLPTSQGSEVAIAVRDTGTGIAEEARGLIFDRYAQAGPGVARNFGGTGLGLAIANKLARLMRGRIELESELGKGSTFTLIVPLRKKREPGYDAHAGSHLAVA